MIRQKTSKIFISILLLTLIIIGIQKNDSYGSSQTIRTGKVTANVLNVRAKATTSSAILSQVKKDASYEILETSGKWHKINANSKTGWVHGDYLSISTKTVGGQTGDSLQVTTAVLNVRAKATTSSSILTQVKLNQKFKILETSGKWYKITANGKTGWVHGDYTKIIKGETQPPVDNPSGDSLIINTAVLNVRAQATTSSSLLTQVKQNQKFNILGKSGVWYKIQANGKTGWVHGDYVKLVKGTSNPDPKPQPTGDTLTVDTAVLNVRAQPTTSSSILTQVKQNQKFDILDKSGEWYKITANGKTGWVHGDYVKVVKGATKPDPKPEPEPEPEPIPEPKISSLTIEGSSYATDTHTLKAGASSVNGVVYQFTIKDLDSGEAIVIQEYSEASSAKWTSSKAGDFEYLVSVKDKKDDKVVVKSDKINLKNYLFYGVSNYDLSLDQMVDAQMKKNPQTDSYGGGWKTATKEDTEKYIDPNNFLQFTPEEAKDSSKIVTITADPRLNVRSQASTNGAILGTVNKGETYSVISEANGWYKINYQAREGWISGAYASATVNYSKLKAVRVTANGLRVREKANTSSPILAQVNEGEIFTVLDSSNGWYKINARGKTGWINGDYALPTNSAPIEMFQFLVLSGKSGVTANELNLELKGKGILEGKGQSFIEAGKMYDINEIYLLSHALLETGNGKSKLANGILVSQVDGKEVTPKTVYNMFGVGAYDRDPLRMGSEYAYKQGWFTPEDSIVGGASFIANSYINNPNYYQDTLYKMKWNPENPGVHQYATDIGWASKQTARMKLVNDMGNKYNSINLRFNIPKYTIN